MPTLHLATTLLLLLTRSVFTSSQTSLLSSTTPGVAYAEIKPVGKLQDPIYGNNNTEKINLDIKEDLNNIILLKNASDIRGTVKFSKNTSHNQTLSDWQSDGVLPFYRVRSDAHRGPSKVVTILGLFELSTGAGDRPEGRSELAAALLATKHINQRRLLGDYQLRIMTNDTKVRILHASLYPSYCH